MRLVLRIGQIRCGWSDTGSCHVNFDENQNQIRSGMFWMVSVRSRSDVVYLGHACFLMPEVIRIGWGRRWFAQVRCDQTWTAAQTAKVDETC